MIGVVVVAVVVVKANVKFVVPKDIRKHKVVKKATITAAVVPPDDAYL